MLKTYNTALLIKIKRLNQEKKSIFISLFLTENTDLLIDKNQYHISKF